jgi:hypothetical protein
MLVAVASCEAARIRIKDGRLYHDIEDYRPVDSIQRYRFLTNDEEGKPRFVPEAPSVAVVTRLRCTCGTGKRSLSLLLYLP